MESKKVKILYVVTQSEFGGAQRYVFDLARSRNYAEFNRGTTQNNNMEVEPPYFEAVIAAGEDQNGELFQKIQSLNISENQREIPVRLGRERESAVKNIKTVYLKHLKREISPIHDSLAVFEIYRLIKKERPNVIHLNSSKAGVIGSIASFLFHKNADNTPISTQTNADNQREPASPAGRSAYCKVIFTAHGWKFNEPMSLLKKKLYLWVSKFSAKFQDKIICVSENDRQTALEYKIAPEKKLITIHNGIKDNIEFLSKEDAAQQLVTRIKNNNKAPYKLQATSYKLIIGTIANLYKTKGIDILIEAAKIIADNIKFIVIGEGPERKNLELKIKKYNLQNQFILLGHLPNASKYLKAFDIFILPSRKEGLPYVILEAGLAELPVISTKVGGIPEIIENKKDGLLVEPENPKQLAEAISKLLENNDIGRNFGRELKEKIQREFSLEKMVKETKKNILIS